MKLKSILLTAVASLGLIIATMAQVPNYVPTNGLVGWWPFNGNANDESGNGNNGTVNGAAITTDRSGNANSAYSFNGTNNYITLGQNPFTIIDQLDGSDFTISLWFNDNNGGSTYFMNFGWGIKLGSGIDMIPAFGHVGIWPNNQWYTVSSNQPIISQNWCHLVAVKSGNNQIIYINGQLLNTQNSYPAGLGNQIYVGGNPIDNNGWLNGLLDDIGFWSRALTQQEITALYNSSGCSSDLVVTPQNNISQAGGSVTFTANTSDPNPSYVWQSDFGQGFQTLNNFGNYSGASTGTLTINNLKLANHLQQIRAISTSGNCFDTTNVATITLSDTCINYITVTDTLVINATITGINPPNNLNTIKVYPNPANTHITIDYGNFSDMNGCTLKIVNSVGQTVYTTPINQQLSYIDLSTWTGNGVYFVQIIDLLNNTIENRKIVIQ